MRETCQNRTVNQICEQKTATSVRRPQFHRCYIVFTHTPIHRCLFREQNPQENHSGWIQTRDLYIARADVLPLDHKASPTVYMWLIHTSVQGKKQLI